MEVYLIFSISVVVIIELFWWVFVIYGLLDMVVLDNSIGFIIVEFGSFMIKNGIVYVKIIFRYFFFDGYVERLVCIFKVGMKGW